MLPVAGEAGEIPKEYNLKGHILTSPFLAHPAEQGPVGDSPALGLVVALGGQVVSLARRQLGGAVSHPPDDAVSKKGRSGLGGRSHEPRQGRQPVLPCR